MLREFTTFENNADGGDVHILFDKTTMNRNNSTSSSLFKKGFTLKTLLFILTAIVFILIFLNIVTGIPSWNRHSSSSTYNTNDIELIKNNLKLIFNNEEINFTWTTDFNNDEIIFEFIFNNTIEDNRWLIITFTKYGNIINSDYCLYQNNNFTDGYIDTNSDLKIDKIQNCEFVSKEDNKISFKRKWHTCDIRDYSFEEETNQFFIMSNTVPIPLNFKNLSKIKYNYARFRSKLFQTNIPDNNDDYISYNLTLTNFTLNSTENEIIYGCKTIKMMDIDDEFFTTDKQHLIRFDPIINNDEIIDNIEAYLCLYDEDNSITYQGDCNSLSKPIELNTCKLPIASWTFGQPGFEFPLNTGYPIYSNTWIMIKILYKKMSKNINDNSGFLFTFSKTNRQYDTGVLKLGLIPNNILGIPPKLPLFSVNSYCINQCNNKLTNDNDHVTIFGTHYMMNNNGKNIITSLYRNNNKIKNVIKDNSYYPYYHPSQRIESVKFQKNDMLITTCSYNTLRNNKWKIISDLSDQEFCVNYLYYYPASTVSTCMSSINQNSLNEWFKSNNIDIKKDNSKNDTVNYLDKYSQLNSTESINLSLLELYSSSSLSVQCLDNKDKEFTDQDWTSINRPDINGNSIQRQTTVSIECPSNDITLKPAI